MNREVCMIKLEEDITNKPYWWEKVLSTDIVSKWKQEALQMLWASYQHNGDFTNKMADVCFKDLAVRAKIYEQTKLIPVMESSSCAIMSGVLLPDEFMQRLRAAAALLEDVPGSQRDWHPGSDDKVLNLVHLPLWPLVFGRSRIISDKYLIEKSLPAWGIVCRSARKEFRFKRFGTVHEVKWTCNGPEICEKMHGCYPNRLMPEPLEDATYQFDASNFRSEEFFSNASKVQVIVKMANIHLTPEKPTYDGPSWLVEGQLNEHMCATVLFYYDSNNITESRLSFRTHADRDNLRDRLSYSQGDHHGIESIFAIKAKGDKMQDLRSVMTQQGRALFSPNIYQHRVEPFELADKTRPGHRKIVALFLVDPVIPIISAGSVPPQQKHWWKDELREGWTIRMEYMKQDGLEKI
ncbi:hypothetical protein FMUND_13478 [Fusarium mundagurra]|uniref:Uncharacterized protein n=1 Tax=Fusarium mundagurra TaxID=1567541 RepID=A0A8H6D3G8_9HYPO|nr:hypothetical protein FMUND_13478 [Fusarium mundagurra]